MTLWGIKFLAIALTIASVLFWAAFFAVRALQKI